ncbi:hypothetical protein IT399_03830, partial [Candidatus Nomurabacteria bacterium]|nr:hypothetical protein [Candidatus Nomurabacteria bacterium]
SYVSFIPVLTQAVQELNTNLESLTLPITEENNTQTFTERFFGKLAAWLADASNGVAKIFTGEIDTKSLCVSDDSGAKTCLTKAQLDALILQAGTSSTSTPTPVTDPVPTPDPAPAPVSDPVPIPEPIPTPDPTPEPIPEPTVTPDPAPITDPIPAPAPDPVPVSDPVPAL